MRSVVQNSHVSVVNQTGIYRDPARARGEGAEGAVSGARQKSTMGTYLYLLWETRSDVVASARLHGFKGESRSAAVKYLLE